MKVGVVVGVVVVGVAAVVVTVAVLVVVAFVVDAAVLTITKQTGRKFVRFLCSKAPNLTSLLLCSWVPSWA